MSEHRSLASLEAEIIRVKWKEGEITDGLRFDCPICEDSDARSHSQVIPFERGVRAHSRRSPIGHIWGHTGGSTIEDLTLTPSFLSTAPGCCRLHVFVRNGQLEILGDSRSLADGAA